MVITLYERRPSVVSLLAGLYATCNMVGNPSEPQYHNITGVLYLRQTVVGINWEGLAQFEKQIKCRVYVRPITHSTMIDINYYVFKIV